MTGVAKTFFPLACCVMLAAAGRAETLIPAPGAPQSGYYVQFSDEGISAPTTAAWPSDVATAADSGVAPAGCNDCSQLWEGACDPTRRGVCGMAELPTLTEACDGTCPNGSAADCGLWAHCSSVYASVLYLRPRNADVAYAVPIDGPISSAPADNPIQTGRIGVVDPDYEVGFTVGTNLAINTMTSLFADYTQLESTTENRLQTAAPNVLRSLVAHPSTTSAATDFLSARANLDISFDTVDAGLRHLFVGGQVYAVNYLVAARYSRLEQQFGANFVDNGTEQVATEINFDGAGLRLGLEAERQSCHSRLRIYGRSSASFLAGRFRAQYFQGQSFDPSIVDTNWQAGRVVPVLDLELGAGWSSPGGRLRLGAGYLVSAWFNTVTTQDFVNAVQANHFVGLGDTLTFDGLRGTVEWRF